MLIALSTPHELLGAHGRLLNEHLSIKAQVDALKLKLRKEIARREQEAHDVKVKSKELIAKGRVIQAQLNKSPGDKKLKHKMAELKAEFVELNKRKIKSSVVELKKQIKNLESAMDDKKYEHDAARALLHLYAIRRWND